MADTTRREALAICSSAVIAAGAASVGLARAAGVAAAEHEGTHDMDIQRFEPTPALPGIPLISYGVVHRDIVHLAGITANPGKLGDVKEQTTQILARIDGLLATAGSHKSKILSAQVWLTDMSNFAAHNDAWNTWVDPQNPPARACLLSPQLWRPGMLVEIMVTAAR